MKKLLIALLMAGVLGGAVYAAAASITVTSDNVGAGGTTVATCDSIVDVSYTTAYNPTGPYFEVANVVVGGIAPACDGQNISVQLTQTPGGTALGTVITQLHATGATETFDFGTPQNNDAGLLTDVHVAIVQP